MENFTVKNKKLELTVCSKGAEIQSVKINGEQKVWQGGNVWKGKAPLLFPMAGALKNKKYLHNGKEYEMPFHGFARDLVFELVSRGEDYLTFRLCDSEYTKKYFPFAFAFNVTYRIKDTTVSVEYEVINSGDQEMIFSLGSHESYFFNGVLEDCRIEFEKEEDFLSYIVVDGGLIVEERDDFGKNSKDLQLGGHLFVHDTVVLGDINSRKVTLYHKEKEFATITFDAPHLLIWSRGNQPFVCIEPWFNLPDFNTSNGVLKDKYGILKLGKNERFTSKHVIAYAEC